MNYYNEYDPKAAAWLRQLIAQGLIPAGDVDTRSITEIKPHELTKYTQCHFFAGIGGWSLALELAGWEPSRKVWTGSCPCQPFSTAGKQLGDKDERHLWPVFFNLIRECRPECVFGEQVANAIGKGWLDGVSADLEGAGYACGAAVLGAHSVGSPHIRQRLFWVADARSERYDGKHALLRQDATGRGKGEISEVAWGGEDCGLADAAGERSGSRRAEREGQQREVAHGGASGWVRVVHADECIYEEWDEDREQPICPVCAGEYGGWGAGKECGCPGPTEDGYEYIERDGVLYARRLDDSEQPRLEGQPRPKGELNEPRWLSESATRPTEPTGYVPDWSNFDLIPCADGKARRIESGTPPLAHGVPARVVRLRGYGNAIVPQVAAEFIQAFEEVR